MEIKESDIPDTNKLLLYNPRNKIITKEFVQNVLRCGNIYNKISDLQIYQTALTHVSYSLLNENKELQKGYNFKHCEDIEKLEILEDCVPLQKTNYEDLEWTGDGILKGIMTKYISKRYISTTKGFKHDLRCKLEDKTCLAILVKKLKLKEYILVSRYQDFYCNIRNQEKALSDCFESFIGAIWYDFNNTIGEVQTELLLNKFVINIIEKYVDIVGLINKQNNFKRNLKEYYQKNYKIAKISYKQYEKLDSSSKIQTHYIINPLDEDDILSEGTGKNKAEAQECAAKNALIKLGVISVEGHKKKRILIKKK